MSTPKWLTRIFKTRSQMWFAGAGILLLVVAGWVTIAQSGTPTGTTSPQAGGQLHLLELLVHLCSDAGLVCIVAAIVEGTLLTEVDRKADERTATLSKHVKENIERFFRDEFDLLKYAQDYETSLLPPRRAKIEGQNPTIERVGKAIERARSVDIFATSGLDFFPLTTQTEMPIPEAIRKKETAKEGCTIRVLICDAEGDYASIRGELENPDSPGYIKRDIGIARELFDSMVERVRRNRAQDAEPFVMSWFTHRFAPQGWFLLTEHEVFFEPYHFGRVGSDMNPSYPCFGGLVPVIHAKRDSNYWRGLKSYFDFLVTNQDDEKREKIRTVCFGVKEIRTECVGTKDSPPDKILAPMAPPPSGSPAGSMEPVKTPSTVS